ncbi:MAG TPA: hypothetical protein VNZ86_15500 [Bacteroidia bacterium]|jgi:hypothetical protein|nr:hypothetical protein [Bacteroidia bacterium]
MEHSTKKAILFLLPIISVLIYACQPASNREMVVLKDSIAKMGRDYINEYDDTTEWFQPLSHKNFLRTNGFIKRTDSLCRYIETLKRSIQELFADKKDYNEAKKDYCDFINKKGKAVEFKNKLLEYKKEIGEDFPDLKLDMVRAKINLEGVSIDEKTETWEDYNFGYAPLAAICANLSLIERNIKEVEADILKQLH